MCDMWLSATGRFEIVGAFFLDFKNAFDLVGHTILLQKMKGISEYLFCHPFNNNNNNVYLLSAVPQSQTGLTALYNEIKAGHNNELSKIKMNLK